MEVPFNSKTVARLVGISYRQLDLWVRTGLVEPQVPASGSGSRRPWSFVDTLGMRIIKELLDSGVTLQRGRRILPRLREITGESNNLKALAGQRLVLDGFGEVSIAVDSDTLIGLLKRPGQGYIASIVIELSEAVRNVQAEMQKEGMTVETDALKAAGAWFLEDAA